MGIQTFECFFWVGVGTFPGEADRSLDFSLDLAINLSCFGFGEGAIADQAIAQQHDGVALFPFVEFILASIGGEGFEQSPSACSR